MIHCIQMGSFVFSELLSPDVLSHIHPPTNVSFSNQQLGEIWRGHLYGRKGVAFTVSINRVLIVRVIWILVSIDSKRSEANAAVSLWSTEKEIHKESFRSFIDIWWSPDCRAIRAVQETAIFISKDIYGLKSGTASRKWKTRLIIKKFTQIKKQKKNNCKLESTHCKPEIKKLKIGENIANVKQIYFTYKELLKTWIKMYKPKTVST